MTTKPEGLSEAEYLDIVARIQQAMCIVPFHPDESDVVMLIGEWRVQAREIARLVAALTEITDLDLEGDASLADAIHIADEALNP